MRTELIELVLILLAALSPHKEGIALLTSLTSFSSAAIR